MDPTAFICATTPADIKTTVEKDNIHVLAMYDDNKIRSVSIDIIEKYKEYTSVVAVFLSYNEKLQPVIDEIYKEIDIEFAFVLLGMFLEEYAYE